MFSQIFCSSLNCIARDESVPVSVDGGESTLRQRHPAHAHRTHVQHLDGHEPPRPEHQCRRPGDDGQHPDSSVDRERDDQTGGE